MEIFKDLIMNAGRRIVEILDEFIDEEIDWVKARTYEGKHTRKKFRRKIDSIIRRISGA